MCKQWCKRPKICIWHFNKHLVGVIQLRFYWGSESRIKKQTKSNKKDDYIFVFYIVEEAQSQTFPHLFTAFPSQTTTTVSNSVTNKSKQSILFHFCWKKNNNNNNKKKKKKIRGAVGADPIHAPAQPLSLSSIVPVNLNNNPNTSVNSKKPPKHPPLWLLYWSHSLHFVWNRRSGEEEWPMS